MEEKYNNATPQRPEGTRPLDAAIIPVSLHKYVEQLKNEKAYHKNGKNAITLFKSDHVTITLIALGADENVHPGSEETEAIMSLQVLNGHLTVESYGQQFELQQGELVTLHQLLSFKAKALTDTICLLTMFK